MSSRASLLASLLAVALLLPLGARQNDKLPVRHMEALGRGVVAIHQGEGKVFVSWRLLGTDPDGLAFDVYRASGDDKSVKLNDQPLTKATAFLDTKADLSKATA